MQVVGVPVGDEHMLDRGERCTCAADGVGSGRSAVDEDPVVDEGGTRSSGGAISTHGFA